MLNFKELYKQHKKIKLSQRSTLSFVLILLTLIVTQVSFAVMQIVPSPTLIFPPDKQVITEEVLTVTGLMKKGTSVDIYIDGEYKGKATLQHDASETGNFYFHFPVNVKPGTHVVYAIAESLEEPGRTSIQTPIHRFFVQKPAPTLFAPVINDKTDATRPFIIGVAKNNSKIQIYIDGGLDGEFTVENHTSGTAHFAYLPNKALQEGTHVITARRVYEGEVMGESNSISYTVYPPFHTPTILSPKSDQIISSRPTITGVAKNGSTVQVYIDHTLVGDFLVSDHESGTASFAFTPEKALKPGIHSIRVRATHSSGQMSGFSKDMMVQVGQQTVDGTKGNVDGSEKPSMPSEKTDPSEELTTQQPETTSDEQQPINTIGSQVDFDQEKEDYSLMILIILTIIVTLFLAWFVWTNKEFFKKAKDEPWKPNGKIEEEEKKEEPPSLF